ncbi:MAG: FimB/Mfa2 family fimbrial subunit [Tannerellaceae bacterium]|nr:FimB/Mfa2 family fimbrial subunit [Tannerellaceae bacterium]
MKQVTLILIMILALTSCIYVDEECPGYMKFTFQYDGTSEGYDETIGNDIHLRIYKDDVLYSTGIIPYENIKKGKEHRIRKDMTGEIDIVAWAVPTQEEFVGEIPTPSANQSKTDEVLAMKTSTRTTTYHESMGELYLGTFTHQEDNILTDTEYAISMGDCISQFTAAIHNMPELYTAGQEETVWLMVHGTKSEMDIQFNPQGEDAAVRTEFIEYTEGIIKTDRHGLLPSAKDQYIKVDIYKGDEFRGTIKTQIQSIPGGRIHLDIYRSVVTISVDSWRINTEVVWI